MALDLNPFVLQLQNEALAVWPELIGTSGGGGVFEAEHISRVKWESLILPCAVVVVEENKLWDGRPLGSLIYQTTVALYYVLAERGPSTALRTKLEALQAALWPANPITTAVRLRPAELDWSDRLPANQALQKSNPSARTGLLRMTYLVQG